jgi:hypothetical protein
MGAGSGPRPRRSAFAFLAPVRVIEMKQPSWRSVLPVHPAAELFPLMSLDELRELGVDIVKKNGLAAPIALWRRNPNEPLQLLDGRNRLDAIELVTGRTVEVGAPSLMAGDFLATDKVIVLDKSVEPFAYVISANIHRRHLTAEQKRDLIAKLLKATLGPPQTRWRAPRRRLPVADHQSFGWAVIRASSRWQGMDRKNVAPGFHGVLLPVLG